MTTLRKAAQMALDALEHGLPIIEDFGAKEQLQIQHKAIAALYEALHAALAQPEQEPVGWIYEDDEGRIVFSQTEQYPPLWEPVYRAKRHD